ncbi:MAG TPA: class I SAM-dependent methyltransferase [Solirubrobacterales bacterium]|jgi:SAM-dependent methyltransferase|nr:class I SAM-dependent methyltransferase [Solirubrobacterales bacterium]
MTGREWLESERAEEWPARRERLPHASEAERLLLDHLVPERVRRVLDLGTGEGHLLDAIVAERAGVEAVGLDLSPAMIAAASRRFAEDEGVEFREHDLMEPLPDDLGGFDLVVSALAIHHLPDRRKRSLNREVFELLTPGGAFYNLDCVASPSPDLHEMSQRAFGFDIRQQDPSDQLAPLDDQIDWLREAGFESVDCHWKWLELALFGGARTGW